MKQLNLRESIESRQAPQLARALYEAALHQSPVLLDLTGCDQADCGWLQFLLGPLYLDFGEKRLKSCVRVHIPLGHTALRAWFLEEVQAIPALFALCKQTGAAVEFLPPVPGQAGAGGRTGGD